MKKLLLILCLALSTTAFSQVPSYVPTSGLVGWWPFTGNAIDESVNTNDGTVNGATLTTDRFGNVNKAYNFDGIDDYILLNSLNNIQYKPITYSIWVNADSLETIIYPLGGGRVIIGRDQSGYYDQGAVMIMHYPAGGIDNEFSYYIGQSVSNSNYTPPLNIWTHFVFTINAMDSVKFYINSNLVSQQYYPTAGNANINFLIGAGNGRFFWNGKLDDIGIWNRALTPCEIKGLYQSGTSSMTVNASSSTICSGGSTTLTASGATAYTWMPGSLSGNSVVVAPSISTTYTIAGTDALGCTSTTTTLVNVNIPPSTTPSQTNVSCNGLSNGSASIAASGGTPGYTYSWAPIGGTGVTASALSAGSYTCTVTDANGCSTSTTGTITEPAAITGIQSPYICVGENYQVGTSTYTTFGTYTDTLTAANGCDSTVTTNLTVNPLPSLSVAAADTNVCVSSASVSLIALPLGGTWTGAGIVGSTFSPSVAGAGTHIITYTYTDINACANTAQITMVVDLCTGINAISNTASFTVYPNPTNSTLTINTKAIYSSIQIVNTLGQLVFTKEKSASLNVSSLPSGIYFIQLVDNKGRVIGKEKFVKE